MAAVTKWRILSLTICFTLGVFQVESSADVMKKLTTGFATALEKCKNELNIPDAVMQDFYNFWREDYELVNREMGCAIMCMASKFDLVTDEQKLHHGNAHEFAKSHGADDDMAKQLVTILHECETQAASIIDDCSKTLEIAKCFRSKIHGLKWAPSMETILEEVMTEV
ncbi:general odorant-binding protein 1 [Choristoneura fumiferana]|uniref:general odorant-binding protein 1 n=1 Tax=Choristoneura fumiferana TaxID=7141 RepID=UPI003D15BA13